MTYVFEEHGALVTPKVTMPNSRDKTSRIHLQQGVWLLIRVHLDVLVRYAFEFKSDPHSLYEWTVTIEISVVEYVRLQGRSEERAYQKQLPNSFKSLSLECFLAIASAAPVAFL